MCATDNISGEAPTFCPQMGGYPKNMKFMQLYRLKQKHSMNRTSEIVNSPKHSIDWLGMSTILGRLCMEVVFTLLTKFEKSKIIRMIPSRKKMAHTLMGGLLFIILLLVIIKLNSGSRTDRNKLLIFSYIVSFAMHFGAQIWMTMISGLVLYFSLPRHLFGKVQEHLFPAYFTFSSISSFVMIISFIQIQTELFVRSKSFIQIFFMTLAFTIELFIRLYVSNAVVQLKHTKTQMEIAAGSGQEIGRHILGELVNCPHYMKILGNFRKMHSYTVIGTLFTILCSLCHINYLIEKICI